MGFFRKYSMFRRSILLSHFYVLKRSLSRLNEFLATENRLKKFKMLFILPDKLFSFLRYLILLGFQINEKPLLIHILSHISRSKGQKHPPRGVLWKSHSENMQQSYRRTPMSKCDFNKVVLQIAIEAAFRHGCSPVNLLHIFRTLFTKNTSGWMLLKGNQIMKFSQLIEYNMRNIFQNWTCLTQYEEFEILYSVLLLSVLLNSINGPN